MPCPPFIHRQFYEVKQLRSPHLLQAGKCNCITEYSHSHDICAQRCFLPPWVAPWAVRLLYNDGQMKLGTSQQKFGAD